MFCLPTLIGILLIPILSYLHTLHSNNFMPYSVSTTFALIKPDAYESTQDILKDIETEGFKIVRKKHLRLTENQAREFYQEHADRDFFGDLIEYIKSGPVTALVLEREDAVNHWRSILGPTDSKAARTENPDSIRAKYGKDKQRNACHGSDGQENAEREIAFFFKEAEFNLITENIEITRFLEKNIYPVLTEGLEQLIKESPEDPVGFLGNYLMDHAK
eukprot:NODE_174_length_15906_cov_0.510533.p8 type:complete len:218 gc:universal NODE_174_length_15906_cov_0.510533:13306-13959(+)